MPSTRAPRRRRSQEGAAQPRRAAGRPPRTLAQRLGTAGICALAGLMVATAAQSAAGVDLRADRNTDVADLVRAERARNRELSRQLGVLREDVNTLTAQRRPESLTQQVEAGELAAGLVAVTGAGITVELTDAPAEVEAPGVDPDVLVVHQQDIQSVINLLWQGGAEAVTVQGQRVISTTGVKCVGNTVIVDGVPYAPPYRISGIGNAATMEATLAASPYVAAYKKIAQTYRLGWAQRRETALIAPAYTGAIDLRYARQR